MKLVLISAGSFQMGSPDGEGEADEHPRHEVRISRPFYLSIHEVTQGQYLAVTGNNPSWFSAQRGWQGVCEEAVHGRASRGNRLLV